MERQRRSHGRPCSHRWVVVLVLAVAACSCGGGAAGGEVDRSAAAPVYPSAAALLEALEAGGWGCQPGSVELRTEGVGKEDGTCRGPGGTLYWSVDVGAAASPPPVEPGELGSGEERPEIHEEVCEHFGGALVLGPNWHVMADPAVDLAQIAEILHGYRFVADCRGGTESLCARTDFTGNRVFVTVSDQAVVVEPAEVPAGKVLLCFGVEQPGRLMVAEFQVDDSVDLAPLMAAQPVSGADLLAMPGVSRGPLLGMAATVDSPDDWVEGSSMELSPGRLLLLAGLLDEGEAERMMPDDIVGHVAVLTVTAG